MTRHVIRKGGEDGVPGHLDLPPPPAVTTSRKIARGTMQRIRRRAMIESATLDTMEALNSLAGVACTTSEGGSLNGFSAAVHARVRELHAASRPPPDHDPEEASLALLGSAVGAY